MGYYTNEGKEVLHIENLNGVEAITHIADAGDKELAHTIAFRLNGEREDNFDYVSEALLTLSPNWHGDKVGKAQFFIRLNAAIDAANRLDTVKKTLFYGRDNNLIAEGQAPFTEEVVIDRMGEGNADPFKIIHGVLGIFTEAGELLEALKASLVGSKGFDPVNMREEIGDIFWYIAILLHEASRNATGYTFDETMRVNIAKLRKRFPDKFTAYDANNRDLPSERAVLELGLAYADPIVPGDIVGNPPLGVSEAHLPAAYRTTKMPGERNQDGNAIEEQKPG